MTIKSGLMTKPFTTLKIVKISYSRSEKITHVKKTSKSTSVSAVNSRETVGYILLLE